MNQHWTERDIRNLLSRLTFNFVAQLDKKMKSSSMTQAELATKLGVTEGRVSQVLNNESNPTLETIVKYARAIGLKASLVAYEDGDPNNYKGLVNAEVFLTCWERQGKPMNFFDLNKTEEVSAKNHPIRFASTDTSTVGLPRGVGGNILPFPSIRGNQAMRNANNNMRFAI
jgi:transcriptional regulator with XRE-family HTH domain